MLEELCLQCLSLPYHSRQDSPNPICSIFCQVQKLYIPVFKVEQWGFIPLIIVMVIIQPCQQRSLGYHSSASLWVSSQNHLEYYFSFQSDFVLA